MFRTLNIDRPVIENKFHMTDDPSFNPYHRWAYHGYAYDETTGLNDDEMAAGLDKLALSFGNLPHPVAKAKAVAYVLDNTRIDVNASDYFVGLYSWGRPVDRVTIKPWEKEIYDKHLNPEARQFMADIAQSGIGNIGPDYDHTIPDWDSIMQLGFCGIRERARNRRAEAASSAPLTEQQTAFFDAIEIEYSAIIRLMDRYYRYACTCSHDKASITAECMAHLRDGAPTNTYEALQLIYLYFMISESIEHYQVRSLGFGLDATIEPFYRSDLQAKRFTKEELNEFIGYFLMQFSAIGNYWGQPFYMGGRNADGSTRYTDVSHAILDVYRELGIYNPKIQLKVSDNTPRDFLYKAFDMIRSGQNSIVFVSENAVIRALMQRGATLDQARDANISGCYEYQVRATSFGIAGGYLNNLKPMILVFHNGVDPRTGKKIGITSGELASLKTFEDFYSAYLKQFESIIERSIWALTETEAYISFINPSTMYSATLPSCIERMADAIDNGIPNENMTLTTSGFASSVDALMAVKELVYDRKLITLEELKKALDANWSGYEWVRAQALRSPHRYGNNDPLADAFAEGLAKWFTSKVTGRPNYHGGTFATEMHNAMHFVWQGSKTEATPDGRFAGEEISKNGSPVAGMDRNGVTAAIHSATKLDPASYTVGFCLDVLLHPETVRGADGLDVFYHLFTTYRNKGGASMHFNVFDAETLKKAQKHPENYRNLQVRVCGWNVLWNNLSRSEQDMYIRRAEAL